MSLESDALFGDADALARLIWDLALRVAKRLGLRNADADDFGQEAWLHIRARLLDGKFVPEKANSFTAWAWPVLFHLGIDFQRRRRPIALGRRPSDDDSDPDVVDPWADDPADDGWLAVLVTDQPFADDDLAVIRSWPTRDRVVLLGLTGLFARLPEELWKDGLSELGWPPPPDAMFAADDPSDRIPIYADAIFAACGGLAGGRSDPDQVPPAKTPADPRQACRNHLSRLKLRAELHLLELPSFWDAVRRWLAVRDLNCLDEEKMSHVTEWPPAIRLVLLAASSHWVLLPRWDDWGTWLQDAGLSRPIELLVIVRKRSLRQRLDKLQGDVRQRSQKESALDVRRIWLDQAQRLAVLGPTPFPFVDDIDAADRSGGPQ